MKYRKKPVVIDAVQFDGKHAGNILEFCNGNAFVTQPPMGHYLYIKTLEGDMLVSPNDYVIKGVKGEFYPCKPDIFEMTYEAVA
jgi:hypothetical protein